MQRTCCQRAEVVVTAGDVARIRRHSGRSDFWSRRAPQEGVYHGEDPDDPNWRRYTFAPDGTRNMLVRRPDGSCTFLGPQGCTLPGDVRPLVCRLYPFHYNEERLSGIDDSYCPKDELLRDEKPGATMLTVLRMDPALGEKWRRLLYEELRTRRECHDEERRPASRAGLRPA
jgi:Fe-S-cluster containining protein